MLDRPVEIWRNDEIKIGVDNENIKKRSTTAKCFGRQRTRLRRPIQILTLSGIRHDISHINIIVNYYY